MRNREITIMTNEQINIAIAEAVGTLKINRVPVMGFDSHYNEIVSGYKDEKSAPNYCNDLNEMHGAEKVLSMHPDLEYKYGEMLARMTIGPERDDEDFAPNGFGYFRVVRATALQRAEAFLRTLGKWEGA